MDYKQMLTPVRDFLQTMGNVGEITDRNEYNRLYDMLTVANTQLKTCIKTPPDDKAIREAIVKMNKAMDTPRSFLLYSMFQTVNWVDTEDST